MRRAMTMAMAMMAVLIATVFPTSLIAQRRADLGDPSKVERLYQQGRDAFAAGRAYEALAALAAVEVENPDYKGVQLLLGQVFLVADLLPQALRHFERELATDPGNPHVAYLRGFTLFRAARYFEAEQALAAARDLAPLNPYPLIYHGLSLLELGRPREARAAIEAALRQAPREPAALLALARLELGEGRFETAETKAREALSISPASAEAVLLLGRILLQVGRPAEARAALEPLGPSSGLNSEALYVRAQALLRSGAADEGRSTMSRFKKQSAFEERVKVLESTIARDPDDLEARIQLVSLLVDQDLVGSAPVHLAVLFAKLPADPRVVELVEKLARLRNERP